MALENGKARVLIDILLGGGLLAMAFYAGILTSRVDELRDAIQTPGRVQISIEARTRLTVLEIKVAELERRIERGEK